MFADPEVVGKIQLESAYLRCLWFRCLDFRDPCLGTKVSGWNPQSKGLKLKTKAISCLQHNDVHKFHASIGD